MVLSKNAVWDIGAYELKRNYQGNLFKGLLFATMLHIIIAGGFLIYSFATKVAGTAEVEIFKSIAELSLPPSITKAQIRQIIPQLPKLAPPDIGRPKPVPDEIVIENKLPLTEMPAQLPGDIPVGQNTEIVIPEPIIQLPPGDFVPFEVAPVAISKIQPVYPELARRAGVEGIVSVRVWVDQEGKVREVRILKSSGSDVGFEEAAVAAVKQWTFSPAIQNGRAVAVWTGIRITFKVR